MDSSVGDNVAPYFIVLDGATGYGCIDFEEKGDGCRDGGGGDVKIPSPKAVNVDAEVDVAGYGAGGAGQAADGIRIGEDFRWT